MAVEGAGAAIFGHAFSGTGGTQIDVLRLLNMVLKAEDNSKNEKHGDADAVDKVQEQLDQLNQDLANAKTRREKVKIKTKIRNVKKDAESKRKGVEHSKKGKGT